MAITGTFTADFSSFQTAVEQASVTLTKFEASSSKVQTQLGKMSNALSGTKLIADATLMAEAVDRIGGVSKLTEAELSRLGAKATEAVEKMKALGMDVPANLQKIADAAKTATAATETWSGALRGVSTALAAFGVTASLAGLAQIAKAAFDDADALERLQDRTAVGVETLQRLRIAGDDAGVGLEQIANGVNKLQRNLGAGTSGTVGALQALGLQLADLRKLSPDQQFYAVADALKAIEDPADQVNLAVQLFGKSGAELLPVVKRGFDDVKASATLMSTDTVKALDDAGDAVGRFWGATKAVFGEAMADLLTGTTSQWRALKSAMEQLPPVAEPIANMWGKILPPSVPKDLERIIAESDAWAKETKAISDAMVDLNAVGRGWIGTLQTIDGAVVEAIKYYLEAGVAQEKLATVYQLTAAQVKAVASALTEELAVRKTLDDFESKSHELAMKRINDFEAAQRKQTTTTNSLILENLAAQERLNAAYGLTASGGMKLQETALDVLNKRLEVLNAEAAKGINVSALIEEAYNKYTASLRTAAIAEDTAQQAAARKNAEISKVPGIMAAAEAATKSYAASTTAGGSTGGAFQAPSFAGYVKGYTPSFQLPQFQIPSYAEGGLGDFGAGTLALLHGREAIVPLDRDPQAPGSATLPASVTSATRGPALVQNIVIHVNGTAADVARQVAAEIMSSMKAGAKVASS